MRAGIHSNLSTDSSLKGPEYNACSRRVVLSVKGYDSPLFPDKKKAPSLAITLATAIGYYLNTEHKAKYNKFTSVLLGLSEL